MYLGLVWVTVLMFILDHLDCIHFGFKEPLRVEKK